MEKVIELIKNADSVAILPHINPDGDAVGSCLAMREALRGMGKRAEIYTEDAIGTNLEFLGGGIKIYGGESVECDLCIALDCGDETRAGERIKIMKAAAKTVNIDHHGTNTFFCDANYVDAKASATGEILVELFEEMGVKLNKEIARCLYAAICADTGCFAYSNVTPKTFKIAAELIEYNINHAEIARQLFDCVDLKTELLKAELTKHIRSYYGGKLSIVSVSEEEIAKYGTEPENVSDLVNLPRRIRGTEVAASLKQSDGKIKCSLRSNGDADVAKIALGFGGGGHVKAAGCVVDAKSLEDAEKMIVKACEEMFA